MTTTAQYGTALYGDSQYGVLKLNCAAGTYSQTGVSAGGIYDQVVFAANGSYTFSASDANLVYSQSLSCNHGEYSLTGGEVSFVYTQPDQQVSTTGGIGKRKNTIKKSQSNEVEDIVRKAFDALEGVADEEIIKEVKSEVKQDIKKIDLSDYDVAIEQVRFLISMAEYRIKMLDEIKAEDEDEATLLMLL